MKMNWQRITLVGSNLFFILFGGLVAFARFSEIKPVTAGALMVLMGVTSFGFHFYEQTPGKWRDRMQGLDEISMYTLLMFVISWGAGMPYWLCLIFALAPWLAFRKVIDFFDSHQIIPMLGVMLLLIVLGSFSWLKIVAILAAGGVGIASWFLAEKYRQWHGYFHGNWHTLISGCVALVILWLV